MGFRIGTAQMAERVAQVCHERAIGNRKRMPKGFRVIGEGCYRVAVLAPDGVVYKWGRHKANSYEVENVKTAHEKPSLKKLKEINVKVPKATLYRPKSGNKHERDNWSGVEDYSVVAMPFMKVKNGGLNNDDGDWPYDLYSKIEDILPVSDLHPENVMICKETGSWVLLDLGG